MREELTEEFKKSKIILYHYYFFTYRKHFSSENEYIKRISYLIGYSQSAIKNFKRNNLLEKKIYTEKFKKNTIFFKEKIFPSLHNIISPLYELQTKISNEENLNNENIKLLKEFLTSTEIDDLIERKFEKRKSITLKASFFLFRKLNTLYYLDYEPSKNKIVKENNKELMKEFIKSWKKEKNLLKAYFNLKLFNLTENEKRNLRNVIQQKQKLKIKTLHKYLDKSYYSDYSDSLEEFEKYGFSSLYEEFIFINYFEFLRKILNIIDDIITQSLEEFFLG